MVDLGGHTQNVIRQLSRSQDAIEAGISIVPDCGMGPVMNITMSVLATEILDVLTEGSNVPEAGNYYVFVYRAKTPGIAYDSHPLVAVTDVFQWGFKGLNYHWGEMRQYTFPEIIGGLYQVDEMELRDLRTIPFVKIVLNS